MHDIERKIKVDKFGHQCIERDTPPLKLIVWLSNKFEDRWK